MASCVENPGRTYPLSMTRAATSSTLTEDILLAVVIVLPKMTCVIDGPVCPSSSVCGEENKGQLTFHDGGLW